MHPNGTHRLPHHPIAYLTATPLNYHPRWHRSSVVGATLCLLYHRSSLLVRYNHTKQTFATYAILFSLEMTYTHHRTRTHSPEYRQNLNVFALIRSSPTSVDHLALSHISCATIAGFSRGKCHFAENLHKQRENDFPETASDCVQSEKIPCNIF